VRVLVACEFSGIVREAFNAYHGVSAISCDLLPAEDRRVDYHYQGDVKDIINDGWDMMIAFPPCTFLYSSGMHWTTRGLRDPQLTEDALEFVRFLMAAPIERIVIENPVGAISTKIKAFDQIVQPYEFGEDASKQTCLWLKNLPLLKKDPSKRFPGRWVEHPKGSGKMVERWSNQTDGGYNRLGPSDDRWAERSRTYSGIAQAMAAQWNNPENYQISMF
jgi:hypothetical protein